MSDIEPGTHDVSESSFELTGAETVATAPIETEFEDLTLAQALDLFVRKPRATLAAFARVTAQPADTPHALVASIPVTVPQPRVRTPRAATVPVLEAGEPSLNLSAETIQLLLRLGAFGLAVYGGVRMFASQQYVEELGFNLGAPF